MQSADDRLVEIGRIGKAHGLTGDVKVQISEMAVSILNKKNLFYLKNRRGDMIPARISELRSEEKRNKRSFFVKFDRISGRSQAESFQDTPVYVDPKLLAGQSDESDESSGNILGYCVNDESGIVGIVNEVIENPAHPIIEVQMTDQNNRKLLIPWVDEYVISVDRNKEQLKCQNLQLLKEI